MSWGQCTLRVSSMPHRALPNVNSGSDGGSGVGAFCGAALESLDPTTSDDSAGATVSDGAADERGYSALAPTIAVAAASARTDGRNMFAGITVAVDVSANCTLPNTSCEYFTHNCSLTRDCRNSTASLRRILLKSCTTVLQSLQNMLRPRGVMVSHSTVQGEAIGKSRRFIATKTTRCPSSSLIYKIAATQTRSACCEIAHEVTRQ